MRAEYEKLSELLREAHEFEATPPGFVDPQYLKMPAISDGNFQLDLMNTENDSDLVRAAKAEVLAAQEIYNEAFKIAQNDPALMEQLLALSPELQQANQRIIEAAKLAARYPDNPQYQQNLQQAQKELISIVHKIANLTAPGVSDAQLIELDNAAQETPRNQGPLQNQGSINALLRLGDNVMKKMEDILNMDFMNKSAEEIMLSSNEITKEVREIANHLKELAKQTTNPTLKQALLSGAAVIQDQAMKMKILTAVKASQGSNDDKTIQSAMLVMKNEIGRIMNDVSALNLQFSVKNTEKQTNILKNIANQVRRARKYN